MFVCRKEGDIKRMMEVACRSFCCYCCCDAFPFHRLAFWYIISVRESDHRSTGVTGDPVDYGRDSGQTKDHPDEWYPPQEGCCGRDESSEQLYESVCFDTHASDWPSDEHHKDSHEKEAGPFPFVLLEEEPECPLITDDESQPGQEKDLVVLIFVTG